jgi:hypothetical protein
MELYSSEGEAKRITGLTTRAIKSRATVGVYRVRTVFGKESNKGNLLVVGCLRKRWIGSPALALESQQVGGTLSY